MADETAPRSFRAPVLASAAYLTLALLLLYPGTTALRGSFLGDGGDAPQFAWNLWWVKRALVDLHTNPFFTTAMGHPGGVSLWLHTLSPFNGLLSIPLQGIMPLVQVYNVLVLFSFVAAGLGAFLLADHLTQSIPAAFASGLVFTFSSYHFAHALGHLNLVACEWLPLFALFLIRSIEQGGARNGALAGLFFALNAYCDAYYFAYAASLAVLLLIAYRRNRVRTFAGARGLLVAAATALVLTGPYLGGMVLAASREAHAGDHSPDVFSADLTAYFVPGSLSSFSGLSRSIWSRWSGNEAEQACFLGFTVLVLGTLAVLRVPASRKWAYIGLFFFVLSLGPTLHVAGRATSIPLPYRLLQGTVPFFHIMAVPARMDVMVELAASVLVAYAVAAIHPMWVFAVASFLVVERSALPYPTTALAIDPLYAAMRSDPTQYAILDIADNPASPMYFATVHGKPIALGMVARVPLSAQRFLDETPVLPTLLYGRPMGPGDPVELGAEMCARLKVRYVITHDAKRFELLASMLRLPVVWQTEGIAAFRCSAST